MTHFQMTELIDFYLYAVYEIFGKDLSVPGEALYSEELNDNLKRIFDTIISKRKFPPSTQMIEADLKNSEQFFALSKRINAVESCNSIITQFVFIHGYLNHLIGETRGNGDDVENEKSSLKIYVETTRKCIKAMRKPIFTCVTSRAIDIQMTLHSISKIKWDINQVLVQHNAYVDVINRVS